MAINFNNFPIFNKSPLKTSWAQALPYPFSVVQGNLSCDTFIKRQGMQEAKRLTAANISAGNWNKERLEAIYNEVYAEVAAQNPIIKELNIQKPVFVFEEMPKKEEKTEFASYNFLHNTVTIMANLCEELCAAGIQGQDGNLAELIDIETKTMLDEEFDECKKMLPELIAVKLSDDEKEFYIKGLIAHELRHWMQEHILASTKSTMQAHGEFYKEVADKIDFAIKDVDRSLMTEKERMMTDTSYFRNYKPKKVLKTKDLKLSKNPKDKRYWSLKKHILKSATDKNYDRNYFVSPIEADANNFAYEYLITKTPSGRERKDVVNCIASHYKNSADEAIRNMRSSGYLPIKRKIFG